MLRQWNVVKAGLACLSLSALLASPTATAAPLVAAVKLLPTVSVAQSAQSAHSANGFAANRFATDTVMADYVFAWGEKNYPQFFSPANPPSQTTAGYYYRYYSATNTYLAEKDGDLWLVMNGSLQRVDNLSAFATQIGYKPGGSTGGTGGTSSMTVGKAVAIEFMRAIIQWQVDHNQYATDLSGVSAVGTSVSYADLMSINVDIAANKIYLNCYQCHNWVLSFDQFSQFATELEADTYYTGAMTYIDNNDYAGYTRYTQSMAAQYSTAAAGVPSSFSIYWR